MHYLVTPADLERRVFGQNESVTDRFQGGMHGLSALSLMLGQVQSGDGAALHRHTYEELFIVQEGRGAYTIAGTTVEAGPGEIVLIPAGAPHSFVNSGEVVLRHIAVHATQEISIEWLDH